MDDSSQKVQTPVITISGDVMYSVVAVYNIELYICKLVGA